MVKRIKCDFLKKITKISINCGGIAENKVFLMSMELGVFSYNKTHIIKINNTK